MTPAKFLSIALLLLATLAEPASAQWREMDDDTGDGLTVDTVFDDGSDTSDTSATQTPTKISDTPADTDDTNSASEIPKNFTGTFSDEDPDSDAFKEKNLFGDDEADEEEEEEDTGTIEGATHLLKMEFNSQVVVTDTKTNNSYIEINYSTKIDQEIQIKDRRFRVKGKAGITTDIVGTLAGNELFTCTLDIQVSDANVDIMTRHTETEETDEESAISKLALQLKFKQDDLMEDWFSNCLAMDGSMLNTKGDKEKYLFTTLKAISPDLEGIIVEDYDPEEVSRIDLITEPIIIEDLDSFEEVLVQGDGDITIEPLGEE